MIKRILQSFRRHRPTPEERIEDLRQHRSHLKRQIHTTDKQIDELMMQRIREAGLGA